MRISTLLFPLLLFPTAWAADSPRAVSIETIDGYRVVDGDLLVVAPAAPGRTASTGARRWTGGRVPYEIAPAFRARECLDAAIREWNTRTPVRLTPRAGEADYIVFTPNSRSFTAVGLAGGPQPVFLAETADCQAGLYRTIVHEIGHTVGLFHEHQRSDRDRFIRLFPDSFLLAPVASDLTGIQGSPSGLYDYASVMHYGPLGGSPTGAAAIETIPRGIPAGVEFGGADMLSPGDIDAVQRMYGTTPRLMTISTNPPGLDVIVDGQRRTSPVAVDWTEGSQHTLDVPSPQTRDGARYEFARWNDDGQKSHTVTKGETTHLAANFAAYVRVRALVSDSARGTAALDSPTGEAAPADGLRLLGTPVRLRAQGAPGFFLAAWEPSRGSRNPLVFPVFHPDPAMNDFTARLEPYPTTTVTSQPTGLRATVDGVAVTMPAQFRWEPGSLHTVDFAREIVTDTTRYRAEVFRTEAPIQNGRLVATPFDAAITAIYRVDYRVRVGVTPANGGEVTLTPALPEGFAPAGDRLQFTARAAAGYRFSRWRTPSGTVADSVLGLFVTQPFDVTAEFAPLDGTGAQPPSVRNAASALGGAIAPGAIVSVFLAGLPELAFGEFTDGKLATRVAGTRLLVNGVAAPVIAVAPGQVNAIVPYVATPGTRARIEVERDGRVLGETTVEVAEAIPALFTADSSGSGQAAALNQDGSYNLASQPAAAGSVVVLFGTGEGALDPAPGADGLVSGLPLARPRLPVTVEVGGRQARVLYAGPAPGLVYGLLQVNAEVPGGTPVGPVPVTIKVGELRSPPGVTIAVK